MVIRTAEVARRWWDWCEPVSLSPANASDGIAYAMLKNLSLICFQHRFFFRPPCEKIYNTHLPQAAGGFCTPANVKPSRPSLAAAEYSRE